MKNKTLIVITGPTASGKSALALEVAKKLGAPIISADSRQIYKGIPITTAVPSLADRKLVPHHLVEILNLDEYYSAALFREDALRIIENTDNPYIVVCGGSMMYIDALIYGLSSLPTITEEVRQRVKNLYSEIGHEGLVAFLLNLDADYASAIDLTNPRRLMHAVELCIQNGGPLSSQFSSVARQSSSQFKYQKFLIARDRSDMFSRINRRVDQMVREGMEEEARSVYHLRHLNSLNTIGFKEWFAYFDGNMDRETTIARIAKNSRVYAKKQLTWFARQKDINYLVPSDALNLLFKHLTTR